MTKYSAFVIILAMRIFYHPGKAENSFPPFTSPSIVQAVSTITPAKLLSVKGSIIKNKVELNWTVGENETADQFAVEKSTDGKTFTVTALVFSSEKTETVSYQYFDKAGKHKTLYRIKLINKNKETEYSPIVEVNPAV